MSDDKPKSIWKKSWKGPRAFLLRITLFLIIAWLVTFLAMFLASWLGVQNMNVFFAMFALTGAFAIVAGLIFLIYPVIRWFFCWRNFKRFLFGLACLVTLIALFYAEEDWRGKHDWNQFKRRWEAKGEKFAFKDFIPPSVPDDQNFAMTPIWVELIDNIDTHAAQKWYGQTRMEQAQTNLADRLQLGIGDWENYDHWPTLGNWQKATLSGLKPWQNYYRALAAKTNLFPVPPQPQSPAADVLMALSKFDPVIERLRQDSALPYSRFPIDYHGMPAAILLPHLAPLKQLAQVLQLHAIAELQMGQSDKALADVKLMLRLTDSVRTEPFLISHLVRIAMLQLALQPIYEGLAVHQWSDAQLADLDSKLAKLDFLADYEFSVRGERALEIANVEFLRHPPQNPPFRRPRFYFIAPFFFLVNTLSQLSGSDGNFQVNFSTLELGLGPSGWFDQNELRIAQFDTKWCLPIVDEDAETLSPAKTRAAGDALDQQIRHRTPENLLATLFVPALINTAAKFAYAQESVDLARVAIALERYRRAHGEYPASLDALAPQFMERIPHDIIGGQPLHYRRTAGGQFVLYSVGWNETDDGGVVGLTQGGSVDINKGDWVWRYPSK